MMKDVENPVRITDLARAIAPVSVESFFAEYFEKKHLVVRHDDPGYFNALLDVADIDQVLTQTIVPVEDLSMVNNGTAISPEEISQDSGYIDPVLVSQKFAEGGTIILPQLQRRLPKLAAFCRALETVFSCDVQTNIYLTPDNAQGFRTHYDSHDVVVLQTHGSKTWKIYESPLSLPLRSQAFTPNGFVPGEVIDTFTLHAGDMCYVPRGVVHDAIATDEMSLHITTGLLGPRWVDLLVEGLMKLAQQDPAFRASVPPGFANDGFDMAAAAETFGALMQRAAGAMDAHGTLSDFAHEYRGRRLPVVPGQFLQSVTADQIAEGVTLARRDDLIHTLERRVDDTGAEEIVLSVYGNEITFPAHVEAGLRDALGQPSFVVGALKGDLDGPGQAVLARRLVREGVLRRV
jgi:ribosomal protein L16 Arg81 hydroxylase